MRITDIRLTSINTPRSNGITCGHVLVEMETDTDHVGLGEMSDLQHLPRFHIDVADLQQTLTRMFVGLDPLHLTEVNRRLELNFPMAGYIYDKARAIRAGIDLAAWDLAAKQLGTRVCDLLGGPVRDVVPIAFPIFRQRTSADIEHNLALVAARQADGFECFRVYVGGDLALDEKFLREARMRFGPELKIKSLDFSNLLNAKAAIRFIDRVSDVGFDIVESPARREDIRELALARRSIPHPVSEHIHSYRWALDLLEADAVDVFNISVIALGGLTPARKVFAIAEAAGKECLVGTTQELSIGTAAAAHLAAAMPGATLPSDPVGPLLYTADVVVDPVRFERGCLVLPEGKGLGMKLDPNQVQACASPLSWASSDAADAIDRRGAIRGAAAISASQAGGDAP